ncbi:sugar transferase [uncultured Senegalimassilia sp.]|uniref:sugar transferase n=1 Tax=uncultured Senegalimassilia sp. TaxID=1714350 RepID=UPI00262A77B4|nr:sugar transferase [uncultured Senegalimassilia sp.]
MTKGISVIGPRPVTLEETYEYGDAREEVLACKPGITGWWAATDRNDSTWESGQRQARDLWGARPVRRYAGACMLCCRQPAG